ncbi:archaeosortase/exosortase family protein, partial [Acinetobacter baumannii]
AHGLIVPPIFLWLVWRKRAALAAHVPQPSAWGLAALAASLAGWLVADVAGVQVVRQLAFVASIPATPLEQSSALPVQIYLWQANELRNFFEGRT